MCGVYTRACFFALAVAVMASWPAAKGDLIRSAAARSFPDIAGDIVGAQTYTYDPETQTGIFEVVNAPHLISLGPASGDMVHMLPDEDGTLSQLLKMKLDRNGRLVKSPDNTFQIRGTVVIGEKTYQGLLLQGRPTAFGAPTRENSGGKGKDAEVFDLNMEITGGKLAQAFGSQAYLRIVPQAGSTFDGKFTADFSGDRPLTNLRPAGSKLPATVPEPTTLLTLLTGGAGVIAYKMRRRLRQVSRRSQAPRGMHHRTSPSARERAAASTRTFTPHA
jgi:hypothetical protein